MRFPAHSNRRRLSVALSRWMRPALAVAFALAPAAPAQILGGQSGQVVSEPSLTKIAGFPITTTFFPANANNENFPGRGVPLGGLSGVVVDSTGRYLYVSDASSSTIHQLDLISGRMTTFAGTPGLPGGTGDGGPATSARLNMPRALAIDASNNVYVADAGDHTVRRITPAGIIATVTGTHGTPGGNNGLPGAGQLNAPFSLALDGQGNLYIGDVGNAAVRRVDLTTGLLSTVISPATNGYPNNFNPSGLAFGPDGLYISDRFNAKILVFDGTNLITFAGSGQNGSTGDGGPKLSATISRPAGLLYDSLHGILNIAESGNVFLRQIAITAAADFTMGTIRRRAGVTGGGMLTGDGIKAPGTHYLYPQYGTPAPQAIAIVGNDIYLVGGNDPFLQDNGLGTGAVVRLSREDGTEMTRFYTGNYRIPISFELPVGTVWDSATFYGNAYPHVYTFAQDSCDTGTSYSAVKFCIPEVTPYTLSDGPGIQNGYVRVVTHRNNVSSTTDFGVVLEGSKNTGVILPQASTTVDLSTLTTSTGVVVTTPAGVSATLDGKALIADRGGNQVYRVDGNTLTLLAGTGAAGYTGDGAAPTSATLNGPSAVLQVPRNWFYIADTGNHVVRVIDPVLNTIRTVVGDGTTNVAPDNQLGYYTPLNAPVALAVQKDGAILIADVNANYVRKYDPRTGYVTVVAGTGVASHTGDGGKAFQAALNAPNGVAVGNNGEIYISERDGNSVRVINPATGNITTLAGSDQGASGGTGDYTSLPLAARFFAPGALFVERSGAVVVADIGNGRVRYITQPTATSTETATVLPYLAEATNSLRSIDRGFVLDGKLLRQPTGAGSLTFTAAGSQFLTVVDNGADSPDYPVSYNSHAINTGAADYTFSNALSGNVYPYCSSFNQGLLTGEACQWGITFAPATQQASYPGTGTVGDNYGNSTSVQVPFVLNANVAPALVFRPVATIPDATQYQPYTAVVGTVTAGTPPYVSATGTTGTLPSGLAVSVDGTNVTVSGTPTQAGSFPVTLQVTDTAGMTASLPITIRVVAVAYINVTETVHITDTVTAQAAVGAVVVEAIHVTDTAGIGLAAQVNVQETVHVADTVGAIAAALINVQETIHLTDTNGTSGAASSAVNEAIHVTDTVTVTAGTPPITFAVANHAFGDPPFTVSATSPSTGALSYSYISGPATLTNGNVVTITGVGTVTLQVSQAATTYYAATTKQTSFTVAAVATTTKLTSSLTPSVEGAPITFTVSVAVSGGPAATGSITFSDGGKVLATVALNNTSVATYTTSALASGTHIISAAYSGNSVDAASSTTLNQVVNSITPFILLSAGVNNYSVTVKKGLAATTTITLTPGATYSGVVQLSCTNLPANVTCEFTPSSLALSPNGAAQTATLQIRTTKLQFSQLRADSTIGPRLALVFWLPGLLLGGLSARGRKTPARFLFSIAIILGSVALVGMSGCGAGAPQLYTTTQAAPGNYSLSVVATDGTNTQTLPVALTIE